MPEFSDCFIEAYDELDNTILVRNTSVLFYNSIAAICWHKPGRTQKTVGYGIVCNVDTTKTTIQILTLCENYQVMITNMLKGGKRADYLEIYIRPAIFDDELKNVIDVLEGK